MRSYIMCTPCQVRLEAAWKFWWMNLKERGRLEVLGVDVKISHKLDIRQ
jgi:hypothetical protein